MPIDLSNAWNIGARIFNFVISLLPNIILAVVIFIIFLILASVIKAHSNLVNLAGSVN